MYRFVASEWISTKTRNRYWNEVKIEISRHYVLIIILNINIALNAKVPTFLYARSCT